MALVWDEIKITDGFIAGRLDTEANGQITTLAKGSLMVDYGGRSKDFPVGSSGQILIVDPNVSAGIRWVDPTQAASGVVSTVMSDTRAPASTTGGQVPINTWVTRFLNKLVDTEGGTEIANTPVVGLGLQGSQILVPAGTYFFISFTPVYRVGDHQSRLQQIAGTNQRTTITVTATPTNSGTLDEHFYLPTRALKFTVYYTITGDVAVPPNELYGTNFAHIGVEVGAADATSLVASKTATALNNASGNLYTGTSNNIYFTASSSNNVIIIDYIEVGPIAAPTDGTNAPGGSTSWTYTIATAGTLTTDTTVRVGTSSQSNTGAAQASTVTSNIFHELITATDNIYEVQHQISSSSSIEDFGSPAGKANEEVYTNIIMHRIA